MSDTDIHIHIYTHTFISVRGGSPGAGIYFQYSTQGGCSAMEDHKKMTCTLTPEERSLIFTALFYLKGSPDLMRDACQLRYKLDAAKGIKIWQ